MIRLVQFLGEDGARCVGVSSADPDRIHLIRGFHRTYELAQEAAHSGEKLETVAQSRMSAESVDYQRLITEKRLLPPVDHVDPARCTVSLTGLTHLGSAKSRDQMHAAVATGKATDSIRMFQIGLDGGKPSAGEIGAEPEWAYKGDGRCVIPPEQALTQPAFAGDGGEEAEIAGLYLIDESGAPCRIGFALGNEFADHVLERQNYLYLAHSKLRQCSFGPELLVGELPETVGGSVRILRRGKEIWSHPFESGEANMCHSIANLEHHHFKYEIFRRPGDIHVHFFGANGVSFGDGVHPEPDDMFEIHAAVFGRPLRNPLVKGPRQEYMQVKVL